MAVCGDGKARDTAHLLDVNFRARDRNADGQGRDVNVLLLSDKAGIVAGLLMPPHRLAQHAAHRLFEGALPRSIVRFRRAGVRPPWRRPSASSGQPPAGVLVDDILGASLDGTFTAISILSDDSWRLLSFLQRVLTHAPTDVHYAPQPDTRLGIDDYEDEVGGAMRRSNYHVDGDLLARFLYRHTDPVGALHAALLLPVRDRAGQIEQRFAYVRRLVAKGLGPRQAVAAGAPDGVEGRVEMEVDAAAMTADLERLVDWLRQVLMPVL